MWGCPALAKVFNPNIGKLDSKIVSCHFIGYAKKSKGYCFYCPDRHTKFVETRHVVFLEDEMVRGSMVARNPRQITHHPIPEPKLPELDLPGYNFR